MIYTSYFGKLKQIETRENLLPISIALYPPRWYTGATYPALAPTRKILKDFKRTGDCQAYRESYTKEVLWLLEPFEVFPEMIFIGKGKFPVLLCYEKPYSFCHRHLVAEWLSVAGKVQELEI